MLLVCLIHVVPTHVVTILTTYTIYLLFPISCPARPKQAAHHLKKKQENFSIVPRGTEIFDQSESCILPLFSNLGLGLGPYIFGKRKKSIFHFRVA